MDAFDALAMPDLRSLYPSGGILVVTMHMRESSSIEE